MANSLDPNSAATAAHTCTHIDWNASADFGTHVISAIAVLKLLVNDAAATSLVNVVRLMKERRREKERGPEAYSKTKFDRCMLFAFIFPLSAH